MLNKYIIHTEAHNNTFYFLLAHNFVIGVYAHIFYSLSESSPKGMCLKASTTCLWFILEILELLRDVV